MWNDALCLSSFAQSNDTLLYFLSLSSKMKGDEAHIALFVSLLILKSTWLTICAYFFFTADKDIQWTYFNMHL